MFERALISKIHTQEKAAKARTGWRGCVRSLIFLGLCPQKSSIIKGSFMGRDPQRKISSANSSPCRMCYHEGLFLQPSLEFQISVQAPIYIYIWMELLRLVGSLKLQVSFAKEPYKRDYILQKRPIILRSLLIAATPYMCECLFPQPSLEFQMSVQAPIYMYGVATVSKIDKIIGLFCRIASLL